MILTIATNLHGLAISLLIALCFIGAFVTLGHILEAFDVKKYTGELTNKVVKYYFITLATAMLIFVFTPSQYDIVIHHLAD